METARQYAKKVLPIVQSSWLHFPQKVQCNVCGWKGRHFVSTSWHKYIDCPRCASGIRHRLFIAILQRVSSLSFDSIVCNKKILHFAPEGMIGSIIRDKSSHYVCADFTRRDVDLRLDISNMAEVKDRSFDVVIAFDVLEHVYDYKRALEEIHRILSPQGYGIFTVPQKDNLMVTYEDPSITSPEDRTKHFGQWDHLRLFGDDFPDIVENKGFAVTAVSESSFPEEIVKRYVLSPPIRSEHPLATNYRKVFFCQKDTLQS